MGITNDSAAVYQRNWYEEFQATTNAVPSVKKMKVKTADPNTGRIIAGSGMSMASWGEEVIIDVWEHAPGWAGVRVTSQLKAQLVDWGKNKKNIAKIFDAITGAVGVPPQPLPQQQQSPAQQPPPAPA
ncbi:MAG: hypothetical protein M3135_01025 [Actinomycetota bacterium]|nr:hypothetical protein [Actinomycetota bacterium]